MNDVCQKCRKPLKPGVIRPHPIRVDLAVHSFECANCGAVKTKVLFQKQSKVAAIREQTVLTHTTDSNSARRR